MRFGKQLKTKTLLAALLVLSAFAANAATDTERYKNDADMTNLFLWSTDPSNMTFGSIDLTDAKLTGWSVMHNDGAYLVLEGPEISKSKSKINIDFNFTVAPFTFQFAEVLYDSVGNDIAIEATGMIQYNTKGKLDKPTANPLSAAQGADIKAYFNPSAGAVVPLPGSSVLMLSALGLVGVTARRHQAQAAA